MEGRENFVTSDMPFAAYCMMHQVKLVVAKRTGKRFVFEFAESREVVEKLRPEWVQSESKLFDQAMQGLKSLLYSSEEGN